MELKLAIVFLTLNACDAGFQDYYRQITTYFGYPSKTADDITPLEGFAQRIPYEVSAVDEKFIETAAQLTGVALSDLDRCQQRVVLRLKKGCQAMNDEDVSKMAVMLLNCQSAIEGRRVYPCDERMSIGECTGAMDPDTWNTYHLMANRARAVCYAARQTQFVGVTEHTVTRLLDASRAQVDALGRLAGAQDKLKAIAVDTLENVARGNMDLKRQQEDIAKTQFHGQLAIEDNIKRLVEEKRLISDSHAQLAEMTRSVQEKLEEATKQLEDQTEATNVNHKELLQDLIKIQKKTQEIFERIEESSRRLMLQNAETQKQYDFTMKQLNQVNDTVHSLVSVIYNTRDVLEERLSWISTALGGTDIAVDRLYLLLWHMSFMVIGMIMCAFLNCNVSSRILVTFIPVINLIFGLYQSPMALNPFDLFISLFTTLMIINGLSFSAKFYSNRKNQPKPVLQSLDDPILVDEEIRSSQSYGTHQSPFKECIDLRSNASSKDVIDNEDTLSEMLYSPTPPMSRIGNYRSASRSRTPSHFKSPLTNGICHARTRVGTPCKLAPVAGRTFCHVHQTGDSVIM